MELPAPTALSVRSTMAMAHSMNITAHHVVAFERTLAAPRGPKAVWLPAPPKAPARSAALPLCSSTTMISTRQFKMKKLVSSHEANRKPSTTTPTPINKATVHFIHIGMSNLSNRKDRGKSRLHNLAARSRRYKTNSTRLKSAST